MTEEELNELRDLLIRLEKLIQKYGGKYYLIQSKTINEMIKYLNSLDDEKDGTDYIVNSYKTLFPPQGGLNDFYIDDNDFQTRLKLNKPLDELKNRIWEIMKQYI